MDTPNGHCGLKDAQDAYTFSGICVDSCLKKKNLLFAAYRTSLIHSALMFRFNKCSTIKTISNKESIFVIQECLWQEIVYSKERIFIILQQNTEI